MSNSIRRKALCFFFASAALAACAAPDPTELRNRPTGDVAPEPAAPGEAPLPPETRSDAVAPAQAQADAVMAQVAFGLDAAELGGLFTGRLLAEDFDGAPYVYIVLTSKDQGIADPLSFAPAPSPAPGDTITVVGAAPHRPPVNMIAQDHGLLASLRAAIAALGGTAQLERVVAASPTAFLLEDRKGNYWDVETQSLVPADVIAERRAEIAEQMRRPEALEEAGRLREEWDAHLADAPSDDTSTPAAFARPDGNLDLARAVVATHLNDSAALLTVPTLTPAEAEQAERTGHGFAYKGEDQCHRRWFFGWRTTCYPVELGYISNDARKAHYPRQTAAFTLPRCIVGGNVANVSQGCGPAAFTSLVWRAWQDGMDFPSLRGFSRDPRPHWKDTPYPTANGGSGFGANMEHVLGVAFSREMSTCTPDRSQGLTLPNLFHGGANRWLQKEGVPLRLQHATTAPLLHRFGAAHKARLLRQLIGKEERPVLALGDVGFAVAHYSPVSQYRIVNPGAAFPEVWVQLPDYGNKWINLHGTFQLTSALYWFESR
jgi:hypothetical protein